MFLPAFGGQALRNLSSVAYDDLDKDFLSQLDDLRRRLLEDIVSISSVRSGKLSGRACLHFCVLVNSLRDGHFPPSLLVVLMGGQLLSSVGRPDLSLHCSEISDAAAHTMADFAANLTARIRRSVYSETAFSVWNAVRGPWTKQREG